MKKIYYLIMLVSFAMATPVLAEKWDLALAYSASNYHSENAKVFGQCITKGTGGNIEVVTHPSGALFNGPQIIRAIQTGQIPIGERLLSTLQNDNALFGIDSIPFLATSFADSDKLWQAAEPEIKKILAKKHLKLLYTVPWPPSGLYFKKPINSITDMKGIKFRSYNSATAELALLTGMLSTRIEALDLSQAFSTGVVEAMASSGATAYDRKLWTSLKYFYDVRAWLPRNGVMINADVWKKLSPAQQQVVSDCAATAQQAGKAKAIAYTEFTIEGLRQHGMNIENPSPELKKQLQDIGAEMTATWLKKTGAVGQKVIDTYKAAQ